MFEAHALSYGQRLGRGAIWTVFVGTLETACGPRNVAIKRLNMAIPQTYSDIQPYTLDLREQLAIASLELRAHTTPVLRSHKNIAKLLGVSWELVGPEHDPRLASRRPLLVMELAELAHPTLDVFIDSGHGARLDLEMKCSVVADIAEGLNATHQCGIIHGDVKPGNILIFRDTPTSPETVKLSDFGGCQPSVAEAYDSSRRMANLEVFPLAGTQVWNAPEVSSASHPHFRSMYRDYYSFGLVLYFVVFGASLQEILSEAPAAGTQDITLADHQARVSVAVTKGLERLVSEIGDADVRLFILAITMIILLRLDPEKRGKDRFFKDFRAYLQDRCGLLHLRMVFDTCTDRE